MTSVHRYLEALVPRMEEHVASLDAGAAAALDQWDAAYRPIVTEIIGLGDIAMSTAASHGFVGACAVVDAYIIRFLDPTEPALNNLLALVQRLAWMSAYQLGEIVVTELDGDPMPDDPEGE